MFRVKYPQERLKLLGAAVQSKAFSAADRLGIQDDVRYLRAALIQVLF
jgi:hypothetical protein